MSPLPQLLKKKSPPWETKQTEAVRALKKITQTSPALKISENGKRILQTDTDDHYWGAILIEEIDGIEYSDASMFYTCLKMRILCIKKHMTINPYYSPYYYRIQVLIASQCWRLCYFYG